MTLLLDLFCTPSSLISRAFMLNKDVTSCKKSTAISVRCILGLFLNVMGMDNQLITSNVNKISI